MSDDTSRVMTADELMGFSGESVDPVELEIKDGKKIKVKPLGLKESLKLQAEVDTSTPDGMALYMASMISEGIVEPKLNAQQRQVLKGQIVSWPSHVVNNLMSAYYSSVGIDEDALEGNIEETSNFLEDNKPSEG